MNEYLLYPGCSMESSARSYYLSLTEIAKPIDLHFTEIDDWNCCGATEYISLSLTPAYALISRNLALAATHDKGKSTVVAPCSACYLNLAKADYYMKERITLKEHVNKSLQAGGLHYEPGTVTIRHLLDVIINDIGLDRVKQQVVRPLTGLRVAPYLGCMVPRPDYEHRFSGYEHPVELDLLLKALGAEVIDYPLKTECCGGHMTQIGPETAFELLRRLIHDADLYHADLMVTVCPMCQLNIDAYQGEMNRHFKTSYHMPILFFTQLMGLAFGIEPDKLGIGLELVSAKKALSKIGVDVSVSESETRKQPKKVKQQGLPMPRMPGDEEQN
jgi:heterodisulfide reductase subunit B2